MLELSVSTRFMWRETGAEGREFCAVTMERGRTAYDASNRLSKFAERIDSFKAAMRRSEALYRGFSHLVFSAPCRFRRSDVVSSLVQNLDSASDHNVL